eukprot:IDg3423t1
MMDRAGKGERGGQLGGKVEKDSWAARINSRICAAPAREFGASIPSLCQVSENHFHLYTG